MICALRRPVGKAINGTMGDPEPTAVAMLQTQRFLFSPAQEYPGFADGGDALPKLIQARLIESFGELRHRACAAAHGRYRADRIPVADRCQAFPHRRRILGPEIGLSARIVDKNGKVVALAVVRGAREICDRRAGQSVVTFSEAFGRMAKNMIAWTVRRRTERGPFYFPWGCYRLAVYRRWLL